MFLNCVLHTQKAYVAAEVQFLMDQSDTILAYENKGFFEPFGQHLLITLTNSMDRVKQLEVIYGEHGGGQWGRLRGGRAAAGWSRT